MSDKIPYIPFVDNVAAADEEFDDDQLIAEIDAEAAAAVAAAAAAPPTLPSPASLSVGAVGTAMRLPPASLSVGAVGTDVRPERRSFLSLMKSLSPSPLEKRLMQRINTRTTQGTSEEGLRKKLLGRNNLARKMMVNLALDVRRAPVTQKVKQIADRIERRVDGPKVREAGLPPITMNELHAYASGRLFDPRPRYRPLPEYMPPQFPTVVQPLQPFTQASCLTKKKQLQQQRDELIKILKEKHAMLFNLQRIHFASIDKTNLVDATEWDRYDERSGGQQGMRFRLWSDHLKIAEQNSREAITTLTEQCGQLRDRIDELTEEITRRSRGTACSLLGGGKTKSKYTKSKKSKRRNRKYSKRK